MAAQPIDDTIDGRAANSARSKQRLLDAAIAEFADHGFAGARVAAIAERAGVNKQLISYHFGGKRGLYDALQSRWLEREQELRGDEPTLPELAVRYLKQAIAHPEAVRLAARQALDGTFPPTTEDRADLDDLRRRQQRGEIAADLDPGVVLLALTGMVTAPTLNGDAARNLYNDNLEHYADQLARIVQRLAEPTPPPQPH